LHESNHRLETSIISQPNASSDGLSYSQELHGKILPPPGIRISDYPGQFDASVTGYHSVRQENGLTRCRDEIDADVRKELVATSVVQHQNVRSKAAAGIEQRKAASSGDILGATHKGINKTARATLASWKRHSRRMVVPVEDLEDYLRGK
jgi:hypothetical protein